MKEPLSADAQSFDWIDLCGCDFYCFSVKLHAASYNQLIWVRTPCSRSIERGTDTDSNQNCWCLGYTRLVIVLHLFCNLANCRRMDICTRTHKR